MKFSNVKLRTKQGRVVELIWNNAIEKFVQKQGKTIIPESEIKEALNFIIANIKEGDIDV